MLESCNVYVSPKNLSYKYNRLKGGYSIFNSHYKIKILLDSVIPLVKQIKNKDTCFLFMQFSPINSNKIESIFPNNIKYESEIVTLESNDSNMNNCSVIQINKKREIFCSKYNQSIDTLNSNYSLSSILKTKEIALLKFAKSKCMGCTMYHLCLKIWKNKYGVIKYKYLEFNGSRFIELVKFKKSSLNDSIKLHPNEKGKYKNQLKYKVRYIN